MSKLGRQVGKENRFPGTLITIVMKMGVCENGCKWKNIYMHIYILDTSVCIGIGRSYPDFWKHLQYITSLDRKIEGAIVKEYIYVPRQFAWLIDK